MPEKEISLETIDEVISLRKNYVTLDSISRKVGLSSYYVEKILRNELGDDYSKYYWNQRNLTPRKINKIVKSRLQRKKLKEISEAVGVSIATVQEILKKELGEEYVKHYRTQKNISPEDIQEIVKLRKQRKSLDEISELVGISRVTIYKILKEELGDDYSKYCGNRISYSPKTIKETVTLRKQRKTLKEISSSVGIPECAVIRILKDELKENYYYYTCRVKYIPEHIVRQIIRLRTKRGESIQKLSIRFNLSFRIIEKILKKELGKKYKKYCYRMSLYHREQIIKLDKKDFSYEQIARRLKVSVPYVRKTLERSFYQLFDEITSETPFDEYKELKEEGHVFMQDIRNRIKRGANMRNESKLSPIVLFLFFKMKCANFTDDHYLKLSGITREELRKGLKAVLPYYPEYQGRDKKTLVIGSINKVQKEFNFNPHFFNTSMILLDKFWPRISNTKEEVIAGILSILTVIKLNITSVRCVEVCNFLGIRSSSLHYHMKNSFEISEFQGFKNSAHAIKGML